MFLGLSEPFGRETSVEIVSQLVEVVSDVVEGFLVEAAAIKAVAESIINEEVSVVNNETELDMFSFTEGKCVLMRAPC